MSKRIYTSAAYVNIVNAEEFIDVILEDKYKDISDDIAAIELLGLENCGKQPVVQISYTNYDNIHPHFRIDEMFASHCHISHKIIKLPIVYGDNVNFKEALIKQLEDIIQFDEQQDTESIEDICERLSVRSLENFGSPNYFIKFGDEKYAIVDTEDLVLKHCVYNKQVRAGIAFQKHTAFGVKIMK